MDLSEFGKRPATFMQKLWLVANDEQYPDPLIKWCSSGKRIIIDEVGFEEEALNRYPGFVKSSSIKSFKKRLTSFGFRALQQCKQTTKSKRRRPSSPTVKSEYLHPNFQKGRPDLLRFVVSCQEKHYDLKQVERTDRIKIADTSEVQEPPPATQLNNHCCCCRNHTDTKDISEKEKSEKVLETGGGDEVNVRSEKSESDVCKCPEYELPTNPAELHPNERLVMLPYMLTKQGYVPLAPSGLYSRSRWSVGKQKVRTNILDKEDTQQRKKRKKGQYPEGIETFVNHEFNDFEEYKSSETDDQLFGNQKKQASQLSSDAQMATAIEPEKCIEDGNFLGDMDEESPPGSYTQDSADSQQDFNLDLFNLESDIVQQAVDEADITAVLAADFTAGGGAPGYWDDVTMTVADVVTVSGND